MELNFQFSSQPPTVEEEEPSVLEYAREAGICNDYTNELPSLHDLSISLKNAFDQDPRDPFDDDLANAATAAVQLTRQRLSITRDVALLLKEVLSLRDAAPNGDANGDDDRRRILELKMEIPVLSTDAEIDMLGFGRREELDVRDLRTRLPSEDVDEENDEGFGWPVEYLAYSALYDGKIKGEKLAVTKGDLSFLQGAVRDEYTTEDYKKMIEEDLKARRDLIPRHLTPPLLPLSPPLTPYIPSSPGNHLPLAPESSDPIGAEARALEREIMAKDSLIRQHSGSSDSMLLDTVDLNAFIDVDPVTNLHLADHLPKTLKRRAEELKVEGPLTPPILSDSPMKKLKSVTFADLDQVCGALEPWIDEDRPDTSDPQGSMDELFKSMEPLAKEAKRKVENEKLSGPDTVARVEVPDIDFTLPVAPWDQYSRRKSERLRTGVTELESQMRFLIDVKHNDLKSASTWHGISDLEFPWCWFATPISNIKLNEKLHGEFEFEKIQAELTAGRIATSSNEVWKKDGLRILDEDGDEEEEELELAEVEEWDDIESLIRKRKLELEENEEVNDGQGKARSRTESHNKRQPVAVESHHTRTGPSFTGGPRKLNDVSTGSNHQQSQMVPAQFEHATEQKEAATELMFGGFSASTALHKFMETQGKADRIPETGQQGNIPPVPTQTLPVSQKEDPIEHNILIAPRTAVPTPLDLPPSSLIISSTLLQRRTLMRRVEHLHPKAELLYRDYNLPHCPSSEADLILSPSTGLILTTLQQIKQVPLPGQTARSPVKGRMTLLQARYERLIVLISEGLSRDMEELGSSRPEDARDKEALKQLETFAQHLEGDVSASYVKGGDLALARSIVEHVTAYALPHGTNDIGGVKLLPVETTWELFLRRAGLNPFAAQVLLAALKHPTTISLPPPSSHQRMVQVHGLSRFLLMEHEERVKRFQAVVGGGRVLGNVGALLDKGWISAMYGFRV